MPEKIEIISKYDTDYQWKIKKSRKNISIKSYENIMKT